MKKLEWKECPKDRDPGVYAGGMRYLINGEIREAFLHAGGESFTYVPCLNDSPAHISALAAVIDENLSGWLPVKEDASR